MSIKTSNRSVGVNLSLCGDISVMSHFRRIKPTEPESFGVDDYCCRPSSVARGNTKHSRCVVYLRTPKVLSIFGLIGKSKVRPSVVELIPVDVINFCFGPSVRDVEIRESVSKVLMPVDSYLCIPAMRNSFSSLFAYANVRTFSTFLSPGKYAGSGVVVKQFAQTLCGKIGLSHDTVPSLIGQRPARVISTGGLRYFITRACSCAAVIAKCLHKAAIAAAAVCMPTNHCGPFHPNGALAPFNRY